MYRVPYSMQVMSGILLKTVTGILLGIALTLPLQAQNDQAPWPGPIPWLGRRPPDDRVGKEKQDSLVGWQIWWGVDRSPYRMADLASKVKIFLPDS